MKDPKVNQKVMIRNEKGEEQPGVISEVIPPSEYNSGRIIVYVSSRRRQYYAEFWYDDIDRSLILL